MGQPEEAHAWIGSTATRKFSNQRYGVLEIAYSPDLEIITEHCAQDDGPEITGTRGSSGSIAVTVARLTARRSRSTPTAERRASASTMRRPDGRRVSFIPCGTSLTR